MPRISRESVTEVQSERKRRTPVSQRNVLTVKNKDDGYVYRIVNDVDNRINQFIEGGWETVLDKDVDIGDKRVNAAKPEGSLAQVSVGNGTKALVMRIRKEWYDEDQAAKSARIDEAEQSMYEDARKDTYGEIKREVAFARPS